jgi:predicted methyltransferase
MLPVKKKVESDGRIAIGEVLNMAKIKPGDWVEITPAKNKITIKIAKRIKPKGAVRAAAGILNNNNTLVEEMLRIREDEDDRTGTSLQQVYPGY